jgi:hypothetical protein
MGEDLVIKASYFFFFFRIVSISRKHTSIHLVQVVKLES